MLLHFPKCIAIGYADTKFYKTVPNICSYEVKMKLSALIGLLVITASSGALAAEVAKPEMKMECCCKKDEQGKMACCKDKAKDGEKTGHEGHDMEGMSHK